MLFMHSTTFFLSCPCHMKKRRIAYRYIVCLRISIDINTCHAHTILLLFTPLKIRIMPRGKMQNDNVTQEDDFQEMNHETEYSRQ